MRMNYVEMMGRTLLARTILWIPAMLSVIPICICITIVSANIS